MTKTTSVNPLEIAVKKLEGPSAVGRALGITKQAVDGWRAKGSTPAHYMRALSRASGVPLDDFLEFEEIRQGVMVDSLAQALAESAEDHAFKK